MDSRKVSGILFHNIFDVPEFRQLRGKQVYFIVFAIFVIYAGWMITPYIRSVIVRDSAVTTWLRASVAPIDGQLVSELPQVGSIVGDDGHIVDIRNDLLLNERRSVEDSRDRALDAANSIVEAREYIAELESMDRQRIASRKENERVFHDQLGYRNCEFAYRARGQ